MRFSEDFIEKVTSATNLVDLISQYTQLKPSGGGYMGRCPFPDHQERTASFSVSEAKQVYHCFGCKKSGNVFTFLRDYSGMAFPEAVEFLANKSGIPIPQDAVFQKDDGVARAKKEAFDLNREALQFFQRQLQKQPVASEVRAYLQKRGLSSEIVDEFQIGYSPPEWDGLSKHFQNQNRSLKSAEDARLVKSKGPHQYFDVFRDRLMFPILSVTEEVLGFGGRVISKGEPKYLNSPETKVFHKGKVLYGLHRTARHIRAEDQAIIVEGYMDVISLYAAGFKNVAAPMGTALTPEQCRLLMRMTRNVVVLFDGDSAGIDAAERSLPILLEAGLFPRALILPDGLDPDDFVRQRGSSELKQKIDQAGDLFSWVLGHWMQGFSGEPSQKVRLMDRIQPVFQTIQDPRLKQLYFQEIQFKMGVSPQWLKEALSANSNKSMPRPQKTISVPEKTENHEKNLTEPTLEVLSVKKAPEAEKVLVSLAFKNRANLETLENENVIEKISDVGIQNLLNRALVIYRQTPEKFDKLPVLLSTYVDAPEILLSSYAMGSAGLNNSALMIVEDSVENGELENGLIQEKQLLKDCMIKIRLHFLETQTKKIQSEMKIQPTPDKIEEFMRLQKEKLEIMNSRLQNNKGE